MKKTIKIIDLIITQANEKELPKKLKVDDDEYEYNRWVSDYTKIGEKINYCLFRDYVFDTNNNRLNKEVEILDEEEFEDIEQLVLRTFERTGQAITTDRLEDYCDYNFEMIENTIAKIVLNQKKIIERLKESE